MSEERTGRCCERKSAGDFKDGGKKPKGREMQRFSELEKVKEVTFPLAPPVGAQSCSYLDFRTLTSIVEIIYVCCPKPLNL